MREFKTFCRHPFSNMRQRVQGWRCNRRKLSSGSLNSDLEVVCKDAQVVCVKNGMHQFAQVDQPGKLMVVMW